MILREEDIYLGLIGVVAIFFTSAVGFSMFSKKKSKVLLYFAVSWLCNGVYLLLETLAFFTLDMMVWKLAISVMSFSFLLWMVFIDYTINDGIGFKKFAIGAVYVSVILIWTWRPENTITTSPISLTSWLITIPFETIFFAMNDSFALLFGISFSYWAIKTWKESPADYRKPSGIISASGVFLVITAILVIMNDFKIIEDEEGIISGLMYVPFLLSVVSSAVIIKKYPALLHLLPYRVYRLIISSKNGANYYEYKWSEDKIDTVMLAGLLSAIGTMTKGTMEKIKTGHIKEVVLDKANFIMVNDYSPVTIGIITSKTSKDLKDSIEKFANDFVKKYYNLLYTKDGFPVDIRQEPSTVFLDADMKALVQEYFSNVPNFVMAKIAPELMENLEQPSKPAGGNAS